VAPGDGIFPLLLLAVRAEARERLATIPDHERQALLLIAAERRDPDEAAAALGVSRPIVLARTVRGLRALVGETASATPLDYEIGEYVINRGPTIERDVLAARLRAEGIDPLELHLLDDAAGLARRLTSSAKSRFEVATDGE
jgi:hypothetical protein